MSAFARIIGVALLLSGALAQSVLAATSPSFLQTPRNGGVRFIGGTDAVGAFKTAFTAGANGSKIFALQASSNNTSATTVLCTVVSGGVNYGGVQIDLPASAGYAGASPPVPLLAPATWPGLPADTDGNPFLYLQSGDQIQCYYGNAISAGAQVSVIVQGADF